MLGKGNKKEMEIITGKVENSFTNERLTHHSRLGVVWNYVRSTGFIRLINWLSPTTLYDSIKVSNIQVLISILLAHISGIHCFMRIEHYINDPLSSHFLQLQNKIEDNILKGRLSKVELSSIKRVCFH